MSNIKRYLESIDRRERLFNPPLNTFEVDMEAMGRDYFAADFQYEILMNQIKEFESELNEDEEIGIQLASFGQSMLMQVVEISYHNPSLIFFYGYVGERWSQLIQHVNQLNFLLTVLPKLNPEVPTRRIGFTSDVENEDF